MSVTGLQSGTISQISSGRNGSCALFTNSTVQCWGYNLYGQLGNGTTTNSSVPVSVTGLQSGTISQITHGYYCVCAFFTNNTGQCWGYNTHGELGNGTNTSSSVPVNITGLQSATISQIAGGNITNCVLFTNSIIQCWGHNGDGQLGNGTTGGGSLVPASVGHLQSGTISQIAVGGYSNCALFSNSTIQCWGDNSSGQLGNGTTTNSSVPVSVTGLQSGTISQISASQNGSFCALFTNNTIQCWGNNSSGQLGDGTTTNRSTPVNVIF